MSDRRSLTNCLKTSPIPIAILLIHTWHLATCFVDEVMSEKEKLRVMVHVFGRATPVVLDYTNVEKS